MKKLLSIILVMLMIITASAEKKSVFLYAGQSNADGREYVQNLPDYMKVGTSPYSPYTHLRWASICGNPTASTFGTRQMATGERYAFCDVTNYWIDQVESKDFYAIKCAYGGTAIAPSVTAEKLPIWYADATWMTTHNAYKGDDITQEAYKNNNSLTKNLTEGFASLVDGTLAAIEGGYDVKAIMWHQGESDRQAAGSYYTNIKTMIAYMRQAIYEITGDEADLTLPFIFGTVCRRSTQYSAAIEQAQRQVADEDPNVYLIDMQNATLLDDNLHFDKQATEYLGKKMYNQLVTLGLVSGEQVEVEEFPVEASPMDDVVVPTPDTRSWDFTDMSTATTAISDYINNGGTEWNWGNGWGYRYGHSINVAQLAVNGTVISQTEGLFFSSAQSNRISILGNCVGFRTSDAILYIPKLTAGQLITFTLRGATGSVNVNPDLDSQSLVEVVGSKTVGTSDATVTYRVRYNVTLPTHMGFTMGGAFLKKVQITTPETVNILIGADQKETFSCNQPLDFSPFVDLFKAYVVTGYDDATGKIDCEQVLQVPANTGVLLIGEESTVNAPIIEGDAPAAPAVNLLTAAVSATTAPAGSYVLTTSGGVTRFTKTTTAANVEAYHAYLTLDGATLDAYDENIMAAKTEHVYDITGGSILSKGTTLTFGNEKHHTLTDGSKSVDVYSPGNASGLEGRFAFDNSGKWGTDGNNGSLGTTYQETIYCSVVSLENGDRVKLEFTSSATITALNGVLRGVSAGTALTSGTVYTIETSEETVNLDLKRTASSNRQGFTKMTVWSNTETSALIQQAAPTASTTLTSLGQGLYKPQVTLSATNATDAPITYYYKGGNVADWTAIEGTTFEPTQKAEYQFKASATGYVDSTPLTLCLSHRYTRAATIDLTTDEAYSASTKSNDGYNWNWESLDGSQVFGKLSSASFCGLQVTEGNPDVRYSFAKNIGLANNYGGRVMNATAAKAYDVVGYECYQNKSLSDIVENYVLFNGSNANFTMPVVSSGAIKTVYIYSPVISVTIPDIGYATLTSSLALDFSTTEVKALYATADGDNVKFDNEIGNPAAATGLLLSGTPGTYNIPIANTGTDVSATNLLKPCLEDKTVGTTESCDYGKVFILSKHNNVVGFFKSNNGRTLQAGKSYLFIENPPSARLLTGFLLEGETNGIDKVNSTKAISTDIIYDLQGRRVAQPKKGLYIVNGKKFIIN